MTRSDDTCARRLDVVQRLAHIGVWEWDVQTDETYWSDETFRIFGLQPGEIKPGYAAARLHTHPDDLEKWASAVQQAMQSGDNFELDYRAIRKDGKMIWIHNHADILRDEHGQAIKFIGIAQDISERMHTLESQVESEARFRHVFENSPVSKSMTTPDGRICPNQAFLDLLGYTAEEAQDINWRELTHPDDIEENEKIVQSILDGERDSAHWEKRYIRKDGQVVAVEIHTFLQRNAQGEPQYFISTTIDLRARKQAEARLMEALEAKETLLKELYHRTKNNMQVVSSLLATQASLSNDPYLKQILTENVHRIRAMALVHQKLYQSSSLSRIQFDEYLRELVPLLISAYRHDSARISIVYDLQPIKLDLDLAIPTGILVNELLTNALKYAYPNEKPGQILISLQRCPDDQVELVVADNGVGFPPDFIPAQAKTLGLKLIEKTVKLQLKGRMEIHSYPGVQYRIYFKETLPDEHA